MRTTKRIYWASTALVVLAMVYSAYSDLASPAVKEAFVHLGFPSYFRVELGVMKILGLVLLLAPLPPSFKEWAYAGFAITFVSAFIAHTASGDPVGNRLAPVIVLVLLLVSYGSFRRLAVGKQAGGGPA